MPVAHAQTSAALEGRESPLCNPSNRTRSVWTPQPVEVELALAGEVRPRLVGAAAGDVPSRCSNGLRAVNAAEPLWRHEE